MQFFLPAADFITKLDTIEGKTLFLVCHFEKHIMDNKNQFPFGTIMCVVEQNQKSSLYEAELISTECLNQKSEWNLDYFNRLRLAISLQKNDFKYTFSDIKDEPSNKMFKISEVIKKEKSNAEIILLQLKMLISSQNTIIPTLFNFLTNINKRKNVQIKDLELKLEKERKEKTDLLNEMEKMTKSKAVFEEDVFEKFTLILNEKKKKIKSLKKALTDERNTTNPHQANPKNTIFENQKSDYKEYEFDTSQINFGFKGSLFESTQNFRPNLNSKVPIIQLDAINENKFEGEIEQSKEGNLNIMEEEQVAQNHSSSKASLNKQSSLSDLMSQIDRYEPSIKNTLQ